MNFGNYFRALRVAKGRTQAQIAKIIGKSKMLVSGIETNKNGPFNEMDLKKISKALDLTEMEKKKLSFEAAKARNKLPSHISKYVMRNEVAVEVLDVMVQNNFNNNALKKVIKYMEILTSAKNN